MFSLEIPSPINKLQFLALVLLTACVDVVVFHFLSQSHTIAFAHLASFCAAAGVAYVAFSRSAQPNKPRYYLLLALLVLLLRGGLLASLMQMAHLPALTALALCAVFSASLLGYVYMLNAPSEEAKSKFFCIGVVTYAILLKLFYLGAPELIFEEAYYWNYAQHLDIGYLDHPLMVAWIIKFFTVFLGTNEFAVRFGAFLCWFMTAYYVFKLAREILNEASAYWALVLIAVLPAYFSFGWFMSPDAPLTACWAAAIYYFHQVIVQNKAKAWLGVGVALGLGLISKYTIALLGGTFVLFLLVDKPSRKWFLRPEPYIALAITGVLFSPAIIWNMQHNLASFAFQSEGRVASGNHFSLPRFISNVLIFITPIGVMSLIALLRYKSAILARLQASIGAASSASRSYVVLAWLTLFPILVFASLSLFRASKLNWTGPCWLALLPFLALLITQKTGANVPTLLRWSQRAWPATVLILLLIYGTGLHYLSLGLPLTKYPQNTHLMGYQTFGGEIETLLAQLEKEHGEKILLVAMDRNKIASGLAFYRAKYIADNHLQTAHNPAFDTASGHLFGGIGLMYEFWFPAATQVGKTMLLVGERKDDLNSAFVLAHTQPVSEIKEIFSVKNGQKTGTYYYRLVKNYRNNTQEKYVADDFRND